MLPLREVYDYCIFHIRGFTYVTDATLIQNPNEITNTREVGVASLYPRQPCNFQCIISCGEIGKLVYLDSEF